MNSPVDRTAALSALVRALPYIRLYRGRTFVLKLGGETALDPAALARVATQASVLVETGTRVVVVHGGGPQVSDLSRRLGHEPVFEGGRRVTDPQALVCAVMVLRGTVNTSFVTALRAAGLQAVGLSGVDAGIVRARVRPPVEVDGAMVDFGEVGDVVGVDAGAIARLLDAGFVPVIAPLCADENGRVLNVNADTVAAAIATATGAAKLIFLTDAPGLLEDARDAHSLVSYVDLPGLAALEARGVVSGGMRPKLAAARAALAGGVPRVHIVGFRAEAALLAEVFTNEGAGTLIVRDASELQPQEHLAP